jgi:hypothetical protein
MIRYKRGRILTAVLDICVPREQFSLDVSEAFGEIEKWRQDRSYSPPGTVFSGAYQGDLDEKESLMGGIPAGDVDFCPD